MLPGKDGFGGRRAARRRPVRADPDADGARAARGRAARLRGRRRRLPAEAVRAGDPAGRVAGCCGAAAGTSTTRRGRSRAAGRRLHVRRAHPRLQRAGAARRRQGVSADADGVRPAALPRQERRAGRVAQRDPRGRVGPAREHRHARHRQLHRAAAALPRGPARDAEVPRSPCAASATSSCPTAGPPAADTGPSVAARS